VPDIAERLRKAQVEIEGYREQLRKGVDPLEFQAAAVRV